MDNHVHIWMHPPGRGFHRALGAYLRQNHGDRGGSGKITPRQRRRLWRKFPDEMARRAYELGPGHSGWF